MSAHNRQLTDISIWSIVKFFLVVILLFFLYVIKDVLAIIFVSIIFSSAVDPWVDKMQSKHFPRFVSILLIYVVLFSIIFLAVYALIPPLTEQVTQLATNFPKYFTKLGDTYQGLRSFSLEHGVLDNLNQGITAIKDNLTSAVGSVLGSVVTVFGGIISFFVILVITFYMTIEESAIKRSLGFILPEKYQPLVLQIIDKVQKQIGNWLKGQLVLCLIIGLMSYIGLLILGINYALVLAFVAAIGEFIPYVGPFVSAVPAIFLALTQSPTKGLCVLILYVIIQQVENHLVAPKVMQKAVGLNPIITIISLLIGVKIAGFLGVFLAIPVATGLSVVVRELYRARELAEAEKES
ncbi:MAG: hypothetical protein UT32_C0003G0007 [Parcubacteria group bacterium GW2011_GWC2_39_14]|nr:MAG: hypothetical protein UT32_C0003G0007 [Parcubacteria group bacterium GW2011_GWC2_39_14]KKR54956.1 MAG: hypothetical protein UT91_C0006G0007 [Parcubacteria group bacterium GW2011_GWA2_40_23]